MSCVHAIVPANERTRTETDERQRALRFGARRNDGLQLGTHPYSALDLSLSKIE